MTPPRINLIAAEKLDGCFPSLNAPRLSILDDSVCEQGAGRCLGGGCSVSEAVGWATDAESSGAALSLRAGATFDYSHEGQTFLYKVTSEGDGSNTVQVGDGVNSGALTPLTLVGAVTIPSEVTDASTGIIYKVTFIASQAFADCSEITSISYGDEIVGIGPYAFNRCSSLESFSIKQNVDYVGHGLFAACLSLKTITVDALNQSYFVADSILYDRDKTRVVACAPGKSGAILNLPDTLITIPDSAFKDCRNITSVELPSAIKSIGPHAFYICSRLTSVTAYSSIGSINSLAFVSCPVANITISLPTGIVGGRTLAQRQQTWRDAGFTNFAAAPNKVVSFDSRSGSVVTGQTVAPNTQASTPTPPTRRGYTFAGWYKEPACQNTFNFNTAITESITLYAKWTANTYFAVFNPNGATNVMANQQITYDVSTPLSASTLNRPGYTFAGWANSAEGKVEYADRASVLNLTSQPFGRVNLFAKWDTNSYTLSFNTHGGSAAPPAQTVPYQTTATAVGAPTKTGYTFAGWFMEENGAGAEWIFETTPMPANNQTLHAFWKANTYTVKFSPNGGAGVMPDFGKTYGDNTPLSKCTLTRHGYLFSKWNTKPDGTGTSYSDEATDNLTVTTDPITLYAQWTPILSASVPVKVLATVDGSGTVAFTDVPTVVIPAVQATAQPDFTYGIESRSPVELKVTEISLAYLNGAAIAFPDGRENVVVKVNNMPISPDVPFVPESLLAIRSAGKFNIPAAKYNDVGLETPGKLPLPLELNLAGTRVAYLGATSTEIATLTYTIDFAGKG